MKIQYCSDLHLEFTLNRNYILQNPIKPVGDVLILGGDITLLNGMSGSFERDFFDRLASEFEQVFWICGNHEFYGGFDSEMMDVSFCEAIRPNVWLTNNHTQTINKVRFIFSTLWSHILPSQEVLIRQFINDFRLIKYRNEVLSVEQYNRFFEQSKIFIATELQTPTTCTKTIVVTHHLPSYQCQLPKYKNSPVSSFVVSNLDDFIIDKPIDYWIYGHSHGNMPPITIGNTQLITNQLGYIQKGENTGYQNNAFIEV
ncbi:MAG: metallophosphoesterase [Sphingobacteriales bacterium]|nr:metallophosphoesterase [Sphingobacteriales bacterium]